MVLPLPPGADGRRLALLARQQRAYQFHRRRFRRLCRQPCGGWRAWAGKPARTRHCASLNGHEASRRADAVTEIPVFVEATDAPSSLPALAERLEVAAEKIGRRKRCWRIPALSRRAGPKQALGCPIETLFKVQRLRAPDVAAWLVDRLPADADQFGFSLRSVCT